MTLRAWSPNQKHPQSDTLYPTHPDTFHKIIGVHIFVYILIWIVMKNQGLHQISILSNLMLCFPFLKPGYTSIKNSIWNVVVYWSLGLFGFTLKH